MSANDERRVPAATEDIAAAAARADETGTSADTYRELVEAAKLPPEALPSGEFFTATAEREVDLARAAAVAAARASALAGAAGASAGTGNAPAAEPAAAESAPQPTGSLYEAALADAERRLARLREAFAGVEDGNDLEARRAAAREAGEELPPLKIGVLISGSGTNLQALIDRIAAGTLNAEIVLVISSRPSAAGLKRAAAAGIQTLALSKEIYADPWDADEVIATELKRAGAEYIIMAGYMRMVHEPLLALWPNRVVNLHPALLPSFQGAHGIADAYERGVKVTGVTVHFANAAYDQGPIIAQEPVRVEEGWTVDELEEHIHEVEHRLYPNVVQLLAEGRVRVRENLTVAVG